MCLLLHKTGGPERLPTAPCLRALSALTFLHAGCTVYGPQQVLHPLDRGLHHGGKALPLRHAQAHHACTVDDVPAAAAWRAVCWSVNRLGAAAMQGRCTWKEQNQAHRDAGFLRHRHRLQTCRRCPAKQHPTRTVTPTKRVATPTRCPSHLHPAMAASKLPS